MLEKRFVDLLQRLHQRTAAKTVAWEPGPPGEFKMSLGGRTLSIMARSDPDYDSSPDYLVWIHDEAGRVIEEFSNITLRGVSDDVNTYALLQELHTMARRSAYGVESTVESLLAELEEPQGR